MLYASIQSPTPESPSTTLEIPTTPEISIELPTLDTPSIADQSCLELSYWIKDRPERFYCVLLILGFSPMVAFYSAFSMELVEYGLLLFQFNPKIACMNIDVLFPHMVLGFFLIFLRTCCACGGCTQQRSTRESWLMKIIPYRRSTRVFVAGFGSAIVTIVLVTIFLWIQSGSSPLILKIHYNQTAYCDCYHTNGFPPVDSYLVGLYSNASPPFTFKTRSEFKAECGIIRSIMENYYPQIITMNGAYIHRLNDTSTCDELCDRYVYKILDSLTLPFSMMMSLMWAVFFIAPLAMVCVYGNERPAPSWATQVDDDYFWVPSKKKDKDNSSEGSRLNGTTRVP